MTIKFGSLQPWHDENVPILDPIRETTHLVVVFMVGPLTISPCSMEHTTYVVFCDRRTLSRRFGHKPILASVNSQESGYVGGGHSKW